jgi:hypothetical protein
MATYNYTPGLGNVGSFQVSGKPYLSGSIDGKLGGGPFEVSFPTVTSEIYIMNADGSDDDMKWSVSANGMNNGNHFTLMAGGQVTYRIKCTSIWVTGSNSINIAAGLTGIPNHSIVNNWSGSTGVG